MKKIKLRGYHIRCFLDYVSDEEYAKSMKRNCGEEHAQRTVQLFDSILNEEVDVVVWNSYDDVCKDCHKRSQSGCKIYHPVSSEQLKDFDKGMTKDTGLEIGKVYNSREFLKILEKEFELQKK